jgi:hypothetical protein
MALRGDEEVANKQVILKDYVMSGFPKNSDMNVIVARQKIHAASAGDFSFIVLLDWFVGVAT